ncbi:DUF3626 domain-containing protein [Vibrio profundum]|uniref:DUF3626 domain-containing protein n=1 Tax=Vibrio profundum TaxID=2910247 RepID=UPI003D0C01C1
MSSLTKSQLSAIDCFRQHAIERKDNAISTISHILKMSNISDEVYKNAIRNLVGHAQVALHFHPDRLDSNMYSVANSLLSSGLYKSQFETAISNGSVSAHSGGDRDLWEKELYKGAYHSGEFDGKERAKYGALDLFKHPDGPAPRFGSCYFVLKPEISRRCTYTYLDSHNIPEERGTIDEFDDIISALFIEIFTRNFALGENDINITKFVDFLSTKLTEPRNDFSREHIKSNLNHYIEVQVHGDVDLAIDVDYLVADPSFKNTDIGDNFEEMSRKYNFTVYWHRGFKLHIDSVPLDFRGPSMPLLAKRVISSGEYLTTNMIGDSAQSLKTNPELWSDYGSIAEVTQELKLLWHVLVTFGTPSE